MTRALPALAAFATLLVFAFMAWFAGHRYLDPDEMQHIQFAWLIHDGVIPYRDVFEHHGPLLHLLLLPWFHLFPVATDPGAAALFPVAMRGLALVMAGLQVAVVVALLRGQGRLVQATGVLLMVLTPIFIGTGIEVRPDSLAALGLGVAVLAVQAAQRGSGPGPWLVAGGAVALAWLATPKAILIFPGLGLAALVVLWAGQAGRARRIGLAVAAGLAGLALPLGLVALWLCRQGALGPFVASVVVGNAGWPVRVPFHDKLHLTVEWIPHLLAGIGLSVVLCRRQRAAWVLLLPALMAVVAIVPMVGVSPQFFLWSMPMLAAAAALCIGPRPGPCLFVLAVELIMAWNLSDPLRLTRTLPHAADAPDTTISLPAQQAEIEATVRLTKPTDTVWSGWWTVLLYRRPATHWFFMHGEIRQLLTRADWDALYAGLTSGRIAPALISYDRGLRRLRQNDPRIADYLEAHYRPVGITELRRRVPE